MEQQKQNAFVPPKMHKINDSLTINLNFVVFAEDRTKHYESYPDNEYCREHVEEKKTFRVDVVTNDGGYSGMSVQTFHLTREEFGLLQRKLFLMEAGVL